MFLLLIAKTVKVNFCLKLTPTIRGDQFIAWNLPEDDVEVALQHGLGGEHDEGGHPSLLLLPIVRLHRRHHCPAHRWDPHLEYQPRLVARAKFKTPPDSLLVLSVTHVRQPTNHDADAEADDRNDDEDGDGDSAGDATAAEGSNVDDIHKVAV